MSRTESEHPEQPVTPLELFFDLVFVFAITQVTGFLGADLTWLRFVEGLAVLAVLWWAWVAYAWVANASSDDWSQSSSARVTSMPPSSAAARL